MARIKTVELIGTGGKKRLVAQVFDETGEMEMTWFKGIQWVVKKLPVGAAFIFFGKPAQYGRKWSMAHPEMEPITAANEKRNTFQPVYSTTEKLRAKFLDSKGISRILEVLVPLVFPQIPETLSPEILHQYQLIGKQEAIRQIHFPTSPELLHRARKRSCGAPPCVAQSLHHRRLGRLDAGMQCVHLAQLAGNLLVRDDGAAAHGQQRSHTASCSASPCRRASTRVPKQRAPRCQCLKAARRCRRRRGRHPGSTRGQSPRRHRQQLPASAACRSGRRLPPSRRKSRPAWPGRGRRPRPRRG